jgi:iron complex outermembrane recepter protein
MQFSPRRSLYLCLIINIFPIWSLPVLANELASKQNSSAQTEITTIPRVGELDQSPTTVKEWLSQSVAPARITGVRVNQTEAGVEVVLETTQAVTLQPSTTTTDNTVTAIVPNAVLALPEGKEFDVANPIAGIARVTVTRSGENAIQVSVTGEQAVPVVQVVPRSTATPPTAQVEEEDEVEVVVTGERPNNAPNASVGTRTNAPLRDVPQSIQVIPRQVLEDQGETSFNDALRNVSGVSQGGFNNFAIRGFLANENILRNGSRLDLGGAFSIQGGSTSNINLDDIEQIEVLKGPASVLYGNGQPGGTINITTKQPSKEARYTVRNRVGNFSFYRPSFDLTGPLNEDKSITYRLNAFYENSGSFVDFVRSESFGISPVLRFELGENTVLTLEGTYNKKNDIPRPSLPTIGTVLPNPFGQIPRSRFLGEPSFDRREFTEYGIGYRLEHKLSDDWSIKNSFNYSSITEKSLSVALDGLAEDRRTLPRSFGRFESEQENYNLQAEILGKVATGSIEHNLLFGVEYLRGTEAFRNPQRLGAASSLDIFEPVYGDLSGFGPLQPVFDSRDTSTTVGVYAQNLISFGKQVKLLVGGRFDWNSIEGIDLIANETFAEPTVSAFSPRLGIVYQPIEPISLYASYSTSFLPSFGTDRLGNPFKPVTGQQFEVGVKGEFLDGKASATLAAFDITRRNDFVPDPVDPDNFQIQLGAIRSRGIEFDLSGELSPGLRLIATYALTDSKVVEDNRPEFVGDRTINVPLHSGSLWAVYELQEGDLQGLGIGAGVFIVGDRSGDFVDNGFTIPGYTRVDALLYYRRNNWRVQLNVENLFDRNYIESSFGADVVVGSPFTIRGQVSYTF